MIRSWFDATEAIAFARSVTHEIGILFPPSGVPRKKRSRSSTKERKKLDSLVLRTRAFAQQHNLNVYKKAKLLNTIKWEMREAGHEEGLIDEVVGLLTPILK